MKHDKCIKKKEHRFITESLKNSHSLTQIKIKSLAFDHVWFKIPG